MKDHRYLPKKASADQSQATDELSDLLKDHPLDEKKGANAFAGFSYQQWWATLRVIELLSSPNDFAVGLEFKDDVVILDSASNPSRVEFCQVKKSEASGAWTFKQLHVPGKTNKAGDKEPSKLAKLYSRRSTFPVGSTTLRFVSNVGFKIPVVTGKNLQSEDCQISDLAVAHQNAAANAVADQLGVDAATIAFDGVHLHRSNLPLRQQEIFVGGAIGELCETDLLFPVEKRTVAARFLASEIQSLASNTSFASNFDQLKEKRIYTRTNVLGALSRVATSKSSISAVLDGAITTLASENSVGFLTIKNLRNERVKVCAHALDRTNLQFRDLAKAILVAQEAVFSAAAATATLGQLMNSLTEAARQASPNLCLGISQGYLNAVTLLVLNDGIDISVLTPSSGSQSEEAK